MYSEYIKLKSIDDMENIKLFILKTNSGKIHDETHFTRKDLKVIKMKCNTHISHPR